MLYLSNAFSLQMQGTLVSQSRPVSLDEAQSLVLDVQRNKSAEDDEGEHTGGSTSRLVATSCVGHADIAAVLGEILGCLVPANRVSVSLSSGDILVVGQYVGPRLPEGCSVLPEGAKIEWYEVTLHATSREVESQAAETRMIEAAHVCLEQKCSLMGIPVEEIDAFLCEENTQYQGYPDQDGRVEISRKYGLVVKQVDILLLT